MSNNQSKIGKKKNKGERGETNCIILCFRNRNNSAWCMEHFNEPERIEILNPKTKKLINSENEIKKAGRNYKADCMIRLCSSGKIRYPSIKSSTGREPSILNHTARIANAFQNVLVQYLPVLDKNIKFYLEKRKGKIYGEDVNLSRLLNDCCASSSDREAWVKVITYFAFNGAGGKDSLCPADSMLIWNGKTITFYDCETTVQKENYIKNLMSNDRFKFCIRDKGMPKTISEKDSKILAPWIYEQHKDDGTIKIKGAISIRQIMK